MMDLAHEDIDRDRGITRPEDTSISGRSRFAAVTRGGAGD